MNPEPLRLWATTSPTALGAAVVISLVTVGLLLALRLLKGHEEEAEEARPRDAVDRELAAIAAARLRLTAELERADAPLRAALAPSIEAPLDELARRVDALVTAARAASGPASHELARLEADRARIDGELARELDPRARALLEAQQRDLAATLAVQATLARTARLAALELNRLRTLLESLPSRVQELGARQLLEGSAAPVDSIARSLEAAVKSTSQVLDEVVPAR